MQRMCTSVDNRTWCCCPSRDHDDLHICATFLSFWGYLIYMQTLTCSTLSVEQQEVQCLHSREPVFMLHGLQECVLHAFLAEFRCAESSCGLSVGGSHVPCRMRWLVLPRLSQRPAGCSADCTNVTRGEPVLAEHGDLLVNSTRTRAEGLHFEEKIEVLVQCCQVGQTRVECKAASPVLWQSSEIWQLNGRKIFISYILLFTKNVRICCSCRP